MDNEANHIKPIQQTNQIRFLTIVRTVEGAKYARFMIQSLRAFGGPFKNATVWIFSGDPTSISLSLSDMAGVEIIALDSEVETGYIFTEKVLACAQGEAMAVEEGISSLVWLGLTNLIINPPLLFNLSLPFDAAFRPVHHQNIGSEASQPLDEYWKQVYQTVGIPDPSYTLESFVDDRALRPYFNTHQFSINPSKGVLRAWWDYFVKMVTDQGFQSGPCHDEAHQVFLHQVVLSALIVKMLDWEAIHILPPAYSYPLNLHQQVPEEKRAKSLNQLITPVYEDTFLYPETFNDIEINEQLGAWLLENAPEE
jgi:hypothetical protein